MSFFASLTKGQSNIKPATNTVRSVSVPGSVSKKPKSREPSSSTSARTISAATHTTSATQQRPSSSSRPTASTPKPTANPSRSSSAQQVVRKPSTTASRSSTPSSNPHKSRATILRTAGQKRKSHSPSVQFGDSSEGDSDEDGVGLMVARHATKKHKGNTSPPPDETREWMWKSTLEASNGADGPRDEAPLKLAQGADMTSGIYAKDYGPAFRPAAISADPTATLSETSDAAITTAPSASIAPPVPSTPLSLDLEYPGTAQRERFELVRHLTDVEGFNPLSDIIDTIEQVCRHYLSPEQAKPLLDSSTGLPFRLRRAYRHQSPSEFLAAVKTYNDAIAAARSSGAIAAQLSQKRGHLPLPLVERILSQIYARTVSPRVETLRRYKNGEDNVYGELLAPFASQIFRDANLTSACTFLDLGSGVGNVVLQAALEIGCPSWGVEVMPNPCALADAQRAEFIPRCRLWGLAAGDTQLLKGDFLDDPRVSEVLARADVILVNNQAFNPELNSQLVTRFLDVKEGARIVSLKSFVPSGFRLTERTMDNPIGVLDVVQKEYWSGCVSWTDQGGFYYVATKDSSRLERFQRELAGGRRR